MSNVRTFGYVEEKEKEKRLQKKTLVTTLNDSLSVRTFIAALEQIFHDSVSLNVERNLLAYFLSRTVFFF